MAAVAEEEGGAKVEVEATVDLVATLPRETKGCWVVLALLPPAFLPCPASVPESSGP